MGTSYQTVLVMASVDQVRSALEVDGVEAVLVPVGAERTAVLPREGDYDVADSAGVAATLSADLEVDALNQVLVDSDVLILQIYRDGEPGFRYLSDPAIFAEYADEPAPPEPADPAAEAVGAAEILAPFGAGHVNLAALAAALGTKRVGRVFAEVVHHEILTALNLDPVGPATAFRWALSADLPGAIRTAARPSPELIEETQWWPLPLAINTVLPSDTDPADAAQVLADAVAGLPQPMRAHVGYAPVIPGSAVDPSLESLNISVGHGQQIATYFAQIQIHSPGCPPNARNVIATLGNAWVTAWRDWYAITGDQEPAFAPMTYDQFRIGYRHTRERRTTRDTAATRADDHDPVGGR